MYELQLVNNGCLTEYGEDYKVFVESILLDSETLKKLNSDEDVYTDIIDVEFSPAVKKVDKVDVLVAVSSGTMAFALDQLLIRSKLEKDKISESDIIQLLPQILKECSCNNKNIDKEIDEYIKNWEHKIQDAYKYKKLVWDFCSELSFNGLLIKVIEYCFNLSIGLDEKSGFVIKKVKHDLKTDDIVKKHRWLLLIGLLNRLMRIRRVESVKRNLFKLKR